MKKSWNKQNDPVVPAETVVTYQLFKANDGVSGMKQ